MQRLLTGVAARLEAMGHGPTSVDYIPPKDPVGDALEELDAERAATCLALRDVRVKLITVARSIDDLEDGQLDDEDGGVVLRGREMALEERVADLEREIAALAARWEPKQ